MALASLLKRSQSFQSYAVSRIGLNFNGGTGGGTHGTETEYLLEQQGFFLATSRGHTSCSGAFAVLARQFSREGELVKGLESQRSS